MIHFAMDALPFCATLICSVFVISISGATPPDEISTEATISSESTTSGVLSPPCCKVYVPPPPFKKKPRPNRFREGKCKEGNHTYQVGDTWNYDSECVEHECNKDGSITINRCPPVPENIPEGWSLKPEFNNAANNFFPFCCVKALPPPNPDEPGCFVNNRTVRIGEQLDIPGRCYFHVCTGNNEWSIAQCGNLGSWHAWEVLPGNTSKPYPECCGRTVPVLDIVPDILDDLPSANYLGIVYNNISVDYGNELKPSEVRSQPVVSLIHPPPQGEPSDTTWYLLIMTDPDTSTSQEPGSREFLHWMVGNIPDYDVTAGEVLADYVGSGPALGTGLHRYVFLMYKQPGKLTFEEQRLSNTTVGWRANFSTRKFAGKYNLDNPDGFNVFRAQWDESVPDLVKQFGIQTETK